jgi:phosphopantetheinyl transferase
MANVNLDIWLARPPASAAALQTLTETERVDCARFRNSADRESFLTARALRRHVLAGMVGEPAGALTFSRRASGRACLVHPDSELMFSSSRRRGLAAFTAAGVQALGLDVEDAAPIPDAEIVLARFIRDRDLALLENPLLGPENGRFAQLWTIVEACAKARGTGLSEKMRLGIVVESETQAVVADGDRVWRCLLFSPDPDHRLALAFDAALVAEARLREVHFP